MKKKGNDNGIQDGRKLKAASARAKERVEDDEDEDEDDRPAKKKKKKKKQGLPMGLLIGGGVGIALLLIIAVSASAYYLTRSNPAKAPGGDQIAKNGDKKAGGDGGGAADKQPEQKLPPPEQVRPGKEERLEDRDRKKGGKSIAGNARGAAYRTERRNELKQIGTFYQLYCDGGVLKSARTKEGFLDSIKRDAKVIHETILDGYYQMNMRADHTSSKSIVAYERDPELNGTHLVVRGDTSVDYVTAQELKAALGK